MKTRLHIRTEVDASFLYRFLAGHEKDEQVAKVFRQMSEIEHHHAIAFLEKHGMPVSQLPGPSFRARLLKWIGRIFGPDYVLGVLLDTEKNLAQAILRNRKEKGAAGSVSDTSHVRILSNILDYHKTVPADNVARFEKRHRSVGGNALRAAVLGGNDGLISNFCLVMGMAGAAGGQTPVLLTGLAGLLAGALSMALGEWISVKSSRELYENQMQLEMEELETDPEGEEKELVLIYISKGVPEEQAKQMARETMADPKATHALLVKEELGINAEELGGSAMEAALTSFFLFGMGAILPVIPFFFADGTIAIALSATFSAAGLFLIGAIITLYTGKPVWFSGLRQVLFGLLAAAVTFGVGKLIGVSLLG